MKTKKVLAICIKSYPDEDDMLRFANGVIKEPGDVRQFIKGKKYYVVPHCFSEKYFKLIK